jgi:hypothetical protein
MNENIGNKKEPNEVIQIEKPIVKKLKRKIVIKPI